MTRNKTIAILLVLYSLTTGLTGQVNVSGSFESRSHYYLDDDILGILTPQDRFASNDWLWVQFNKGSLSAGLQYEAYMPPLSGFPYQLEGNKLIHRYLRYNKGIIDITTGNFYEQFGSGLTFRSFEDRYLGINNSLDGVRVIIKPVDGVRLKAVYGKPRRYLGKADSYLRGIDGEIDPGAILNKLNWLTLGAGVISKYEAYTGPDSDFPSAVNAYNLRFSAGKGPIQFNSEYVYKSDDPGFINFYRRIPGKAFRSDFTLSKNGLGIYISARFLDNMYFDNTRDAMDSYSSINYIPSNTRQHTYSLPNLYPYPTQASNEGSIQLDVNYTIKRNSKLGGKYGTGIRFNSSVSRTLSGSDNRLVSFGNKVLFRDINIELNRRWSRKLRTIIFVQDMAYNWDAIEGGGDRLFYNTTLVADIRYKITNRFSIRTELEHLWSEQDHGNWYSARLEVSYSPVWSVYIYDMSDYEDANQVHYLNAGVSLNAGSSRITAGYGRSRAGYICSGGVCHLVPAYRGFNLTLTSSF